MYQYDWLGRATAIILPSGEVLNLKSKLSDTEGLVVSISKPPTNIYISGKTDKKAIIEDGKFFRTSRR